MASRSRSTPNGASSAIEMPPAVSTGTETAQRVLGWLKRLEGEKTDVDAVRFANRHEPDEIMPGSDVTYAERKAVLTRQQDGIRDGFPPEIIALVDKMISEQR